MKLFLDRKTTRFLSLNLNEISRANKLENLEIVPLKVYCVPAVIYISSILSSNFVSTLGQVTFLSDKDLPKSSQTSLCQVPLYFGVPFLEPNHLM